MKIALMSGAYVNAGDFLIEKRSFDLVIQNIQQADVTILKRNVAYSSDELNQYDAIIFGGGPGFQRDLYPCRVPFVDDLSKLTTPYYILGWGWKGKNINSSAYDISKLSKEMLSFINGATGTLSCRDFYTIEFLKRQGITNTVMTGCPAWYNLDFVDDLKFRCPKGKNIKKICISNPADDNNSTLFFRIIQWALENYKDSDIYLVFHRGLSDEIRHKCMDIQRKTTILHIDEITGGSEGFSIYDDCDMHIGFRVHAHIYNLSRGNVSYLINEDARGYGVNDALGCINIDATKKGTIFPRRNSIRKIIYQLEKTIEASESDDEKWEAVADNIKKYYYFMQEFLKNIKQNRNIDG